jgi:hypothetical protein
MKTLKRWLPLTAMALLAGMIITAPGSGTNSSAPPRGAAIDGSEDDAPTTGTLKNPDFNQLDSLGMRRTELPDEITELPENTEVTQVTKGGKIFKSLNFGLLAGFKYTPPYPGEIPHDSTILPDAYKGQIPGGILELTGQEVAITGFVVPLEVERGRLKSFVLVRNQLLCCFGVIPQMNEWVHVTMEGRYRAPFLLEIPVTAYGKLEVGETIRRGQVMSIYRMKLTNLETAEIR